MRRSTHILLIVFLAVFSIIIYANTLKNGFVYDDYGTIVNNNHLIKNPCKFSILINQNEYFDYSGEITYRPVATLSYMLDYALYGLKPWGYHLTNVLLHAINVVLLYIFLILLRIGRNQSASNERVIIKQESLYIPYQPFLLSLLFAAHPVLTEAVNAVSFREDLLSFLFYMATLNIYLFLRADSNKRQSLLVLLLYISSCLLYFFALLSKEMAVSLPLIICYYEWNNYRKTDRALLSISWHNLGYIATTLAYIYLRFHYFYNPVEANVIFPKLTERLLTMPWLIINYFKLTISPISLAADYKMGTVTSLYSIDFVLSFVCALFLVALAFITKYREVTFGVFFYLMTLIPVYNIVPIAHPFAERYLYLPMVGFIIAAGFIINMI